MKMIFVFCLFLCFAALNSGSYVEEEDDDEEGISALLEYIDRQLEWRGFNISAEHVELTKRSFKRQIRQTVKQRRGRQGAKCNVHEIVKHSPLCMCSKPRKEMVEVPASQQADVITVPRCMEIERCSGPCMNPNMRCLPVRVQPLDVPVFAIRFSAQDANNVNPTECTTVSIDRHVSCGCSCGLKWWDCTDKQTFVENECRCRCKEEKEKNAECISQGKHWDEVHCRCKCPIKTECSTGLYFHETTCRCVSEQDN